MSDRRFATLAFLQAAGWGDAAHSPLAGDASARNYTRLSRKDTSETAILMDAAPASDEDVRPFLRVARHLKSLGLSAPEVLAEDPEIGLLLLEDFGDALFATALSETPELELTLYSAAADLLVYLHRTPPPTWLASHTPAELATLTDPVFDWYLHERKPERRTAIRSRVQQSLETLLRQILPKHSVMVLRDFHAENLVWLPAQSGVKKVGLLDFQDAIAGHPAYDLVSLLQDARRDVGPELARTILRKFAENIHADAKEFARAYSILGAQRNLRILGLFARLSVHFGKSRYVDLIPRVWQHLMDNLAHPDLVELRTSVLDGFPPPSTVFPDNVRSKCPTTQKP